MADSNLASGHPGVHGLLVDVDVLQNVNGLIEVAEEGVQPTKADEGKVSQHLVQRMHAEFSGNGFRLTTGSENLSSSLGGKYAISPAKA